MNTVHHQYTLQEQSDYIEMLNRLKDEFDERIASSERQHRNIDEFDVIQSVGSGTYATVYWVRDKVEISECYAMKAMDKELIMENDLIQQITDEKDILKAVRFPFLISLICSSQDSLNIYLLTHYAEGGQMFWMVHKNGIEEPMLQFYCAQVVLALEYLHHCNIVHRDLKPQNIFVCSTGYIKLGDFGASKIIKKLTWSICGTPQYIAPEIILSSGHSFPVDWWSFGVLIYEMSTGYPPFCSTDFVKLYKMILDCQYKVPNNVSVNCRSIIKQFLQVNPVMRLGYMKSDSYQIKSHVWFEKINWFSIYTQNVEMPRVTVSNPDKDDASNHKIIKTNDDDWLYSEVFQDF